MANVLKKIEVGNPLINLGLMALYDLHQKVVTDDQLAKFYHLMLDATEGSSLATSFAYAMLSYSTGENGTFQLFEAMESTIEEHNAKVNES